MNDEETTLLALLSLPTLSPTEKAVILETYISEYGPLSDEAGEQVKKVLRH